MILYYSLILLVGCVSIRKKAWISSLLSFPDNSMVPIYTPCRREVLWEALLSILPDSPPPPSSLSNFPESFPDSFPTPIYSSGWRGAVWSGAIRKSHLQLLANGYTVPPKSWLNLLSETVKKQCIVSHSQTESCTHNHVYDITN